MLVVIDGQSFDPRDIECIMPRKNDVPGCVIHIKSGRAIIVKNAGVEDVAYRINKALKLREYY